MALGDLKMGDTTAWIKDRLKMSTGISVILASDPKACVWGGYLFEERCRCLKVERLAVSSGCHMLRQTTIHIHTYGQHAHILEEGRKLEYLTSKGTRRKIVPGLIFRSTHFAQTFCKVEQANEKLFEEFFRYSPRRQQCKAEKQWQNERQLPWGARAAQQQPPWRPREEPKLPLFPLCAKAFACPPLPCRFPRSWMASVVHLGSPKRNKHTNERAIPQKGLFSPRLPPPLRPLLSRWLWTVSSNPSSFITSLSVHFHFQAACYPLNLDITSTQTPSLCLS